MQQPEHHSSYPKVRGLARGLQVLGALNLCVKGRASSGELAKMTGLHRTTVRRLLETLVSQGYVWRSDSDDSFQLSLRVRELSEGFTDTEWISTVASPVMGTLLPKVVWPSDLSLPSGEAMRVRETTHRFSPLSFHRVMVGRRLPMLLTAAGRAYIGHCADEEREQILKLLRAGEDEQARLASDPAYLKNLLARVRADGYGTNDGEWNHNLEKGKIGAVAVPIIQHGHAVACLSVIYLLRAVRREDAVARYVPALRDAVARIEAGLQG
ncbi:DNA-binding transcriptional regulator [Pusillimonas sp.]|uniref:DNA-binding transcriptional regulator n=1 Tax=Pusillimonas sp. TaxID=3040095 RepID=UPI0029AF5515|nr:DNA-binding transcriptional regulator [Pusillimonas sp.]MDX3894414.1 DNA-binding transcriptional regulator [Pusillimonas sp.]